MLVTRYMLKLFEELSDEVPRCFIAGGLMMPGLYLPRDINVANQHSVLWADYVKPETKNIY